MPTLMVFTSKAGHSLWMTAQREVNGKDIFQLIYAQNKEQLLLTSPYAGTSCY